MVWDSNQTDVNPSLDENTVFFPEVSPLASINQLTIQSSWGEPYIVVSTASSTVAGSITKALESYGVPRSSIMLDGLSSPDVRLMPYMPDTLEVVARMNNDGFSPALEE